MINRIIGLELRNSLVKESLEELETNTILGELYVRLPALLKKAHEMKTDQNTQEAIQLGQEISSTVGTIYRTAKTHKKEGQQPFDYWLKPDTTKESTLLRALADSKNNISAGSLKYPTPPCTDLEGVNQKIDLLEEITKGWHFEEIMRSVSDGLPGGMLPVVANCYYVIIAMPDMLRVSSANEAYLNDLSDLKAVASIGLQYAFQLESIMAKRVDSGKGDLFIHQFNHKDSSGHFAGKGSYSAVLACSIVLRAIASSELASNSGDPSTNW